MKDIDLLDYFSKTGVEVLRKGEDKYIMVEHDSFVIEPSKNLWNWFSRGFGGHGAWDYVKKVELNNTTDNSLVFRRLADVYGEEFLEANGEFDSSISSNASTSTNPLLFAKKKEPISLPTKSTKNNQLLKYLVDTRKIDDVIVNAFISSGQVYESNEVKKDKNGKTIYIHNAMFVSFDEKNTPKAAHAKGLYQKSDGTRFSGDIVNSDKEGYPFSYPKEIPSNAHSLVIFEAAIDLMSYLSVQRTVRGRSWTSYNCVALMGVSKTQPITSGLDRILSSLPNLKTIVIAFDYDETGNSAAKSLCSNLNERGYDDVRIIVPRIDNDYIFNDWNDVICYYKCKEEEKAELLTKLNAVSIKNRSL